jgi:hypothetical protein
LIHIVPVLEGCRNTISNSTNKSITAESEMQSDVFYSIAIGQSSRNGS